MAKVELSFRTKDSLVEKLKAALISVFGKKARDNFGDFRPPIEEAIEEAVINSRGEFQPNDQQAAELGIGQGGKIDTNRQLGAWRQLLPGNGITKLTIKKSTSGKTSIGDITININEDEFFEGDLSNVDTPDSNKIDSIPWMRYFIQGAPTNNNYRFLKFRNKGKIISRTGKGIMVKGGMWSFPPQNPNAFAHLGKEIERQIGITIRRDIGKVV